MTKAKQKGLVIVITGNGKGKTTSALGMVTRNLGWDKKCVIVQFAKGGWETGELRFFKKIGVEIIPVWGDKRWFDPVPDDVKNKLVEKSENLARRMLTDPSIDLLVLDEINIMMSHGMIAPEDLLPLLTGRPEGMTVILTGRHAPEQIIKVADLVSEIGNVKHPAEQGVPPCAGIEY